MAKKKRPDTSPKPAQFRSTPFNSLKGVVASSVPPAVEPPITEPAQPLPEDDSAELFFQAMGGVRRLQSPAQKLGKDSATPPHQTLKKQPPLPSPEDRAATDLFLEEIGRMKLEVKFSETLPDEDELKPLSGNRLRQLKRGIVTVDHQLDLHGLTRDEALDALPRFLRTACLRGQTAALVITGKGYHSPAEPVLQQAVASWLRDAGRELVVEFSPAPREMGGSGAFVVFLRPAPKPAGNPS
ncbi:MAG: Smr/MutS family protein [Desulfuromonadales bacterium]|nr:Smr/MutS family protein [Desulfuromonadales bacterium]